VEIVMRTLGHFIATGEVSWGTIDENIAIGDHDILDQRGYRGHAGFQSWLEDWTAAWTEYHMEPQEAIDAGDHVVVVIHMKAKGRGSGVTVERQDAIVHTMRTGKIVRIDYYNSREQALKAVGLEE
jgi:ketosteroid isomerase-like protein